ncbi:hypothetical protein [Erythrobacter mangrovi]|uniref:Uncharacterized protein n=1 Tax=Erythrobacter mangrovi TaxID=2739433 RepID=A0A7D4BC13_9SPHN|nr:hypothetical protein [Erythrobacter mangrovi]QKG72421.1 hypothetical protein HQR01_14180 [Erythrobacter mangrovi]
MRKITMGLVAGCAALALSGCQQAETDATEPAAEEEMATATDADAATEADAASEGTGEEADGPETEEAAATAVEGTTTPINPEN